MCLAESYLQVSSETLHTLDDAMRNQRVQCMFYVAVRIPVFSVLLSTHFLLETLRDFLVYGSAWTHNCCSNEARHSN